MYGELILDVKLFLYALIGLMLLGTVGTGILALYTVVSRKDSIFNHQEMAKSFNSIWVVPMTLFARKVGIKKSGLRKCIARYNYGPFTYLTVWLITISSMLMLILWAWWSTNTYNIEIPPRIHLIWGVALFLQAMGMCLFNIYTAVQNMREALECETST